LTFIPGFSGFRRHSSGQDFDANALAAQDALQSLGDVALLRIDRENLNPSSLVNLGLDLLYQPPFLRVNELLIQVRRIGDHEPLALAGVWIHRMAVERS